MDWGLELELGESSIWRADFELGGSVPGILDMHGPSSLPGSPKSRRHEISPYLTLIALHCVDSFISAENGYCLHCGLSLEFNMSDSNFPRTARRP